MTVYRGQIVSLTEIEKLEHSLAKQSTVEMTNKSFFSTSLDRSIASFLLHPSTNLSDQFHTVLFQIDINLRTDCRPFADISHRSQFSNENEILFTIGAQFRVILIYQDVNFYENAVIFYLTIFLMHQLNRLRCVLMNLVRSFRKRNYG